MLGVVYPSRPLRLNNWNSYIFTKLLTVSIGRDFESSIAP